jgi:hypothetical protein
MGVVDDLIFTSDPDADPDGGQQRGRIHVKSMSHLSKFHSRIFVEIDSIGGIS